MIAERARRSPVNSHGTVVLALPAPEPSVVRSSRISVRGSAPPAAPYVDATDPCAPTGTSAVSQVVAVPTSVSKVALTWTLWTEPALAVAQPATSSVEASHTRTQCS